MKTKKKSLFRKIPLAVWVCAAVFLAGICAAIWLFPSQPVVPPEVPEEPTSSLIENPYGPDSFDYDGQYLTCLAGESRLGIDVSYWQGEIDWQQVKEAGIEFVMIRIGLRGSEEGLLYEDDYARKNYEGAVKAGLSVGGYFFSQATSVQEAREEAEFALELTKDWQLDMPIAFDWEYLGEDHRTASVDGQTLTDCALAFCEIIDQAGRESMIYFNPDFAVNRLDMERLAQNGFWLAMYSDDMDFSYRVDMWQYTCEGSVPGIRGNVDINLYLTYEDT